MTLDPAWHIVCLHLVQQAAQHCAHATLLQLAISPSPSATLPELYCSACALAQLSCHGSDRTRDCTPVCLVCLKRRVLGATSPFTPDALSLARHVEPQSSWAAAPGARPLWLQGGSAPRWESSQGPPSPLSPAHIPFRRRQMPACVARSHALPRVESTSLPPFPPRKLAQRGHPSPFRRLDHVLPRHPNPLPTPSWRSVGAESSGGRHPPPCICSAPLTATPVLGNVSSAPLCLPMVPSHCLRCIGFQPHAICLANDTPSAAA